MTEKIRERLQHAVLALLLSAGLVMPMLGALDPSLISLRVLPVITGLVITFELASIHRISAWAVGGAACLMLAAWLLAGEGVQILSDAGRAVGLRMQGIETAVPMASSSVAGLVTVGGTLLSCLATLRRASCIPALFLCLGVTMIVWLTDSMRLIPWLLPALAVTLTLLLVSRFDEVPLRILPWAVALTAAAFLITGGGMTLTPLKEKADEIRQAVLDRLFFTEARDVFSLYSEGYSPQGPDQLGGKPNPTDHPVMQVSSAKTVYLRGTAYNRYDGHGWSNSLGGRRYLWQSRRMDSLRDSLFNQSLPAESVQNSLSEPVTVSVRMLSDSASTLFVPQRVRELTPGGETVPYFSNSSEIFITRNLQAGDTYAVSAPLYTSLDPGIGTLTEICGSLEDAGWQDVLRTYTELPSHLEQPVADIALQVTSVADTPFEKAMALQNYLSRNFRYTTDVGEHPENVDFVTSFLLDTKKGYCTYFATAMTVLCRMAGLPARYVEGYLAEPDAQGEALVTGLMAHAWSEVYFKGFGWLTFDATPRRRSSQGQDPSGSPPQSQEDSGPTPEPHDSPEPQEPEETEEPDAAEMPDSGESAGTEEPSSEPPEADTATPQPSEDGGGSSEIQPEQPSGSARFPWWLLLFVATAGLLGLRCLLTSPAFRDRRAETEEEKFDLWAQEIEDLLCGEKLIRRKGETPMAFSRRVDGTGLFSESISPAGECLSLMRYSKAEPLETDTRLMRDTALLLRGEICAQARCRYWIVRIFRKRLRLNNVHEKRGRKREKTCQKRDQNI